ncbi:hypothetical protein Leryth_003949 [Lithospermum erythrorhizon]|nr:hypothetical protein Leryth_003949 [Lithospermum erythrorhizon]
MATKGISSQKKMNQGSMVLLSSAMCEWFLIFLLFIDATFSYILRRFAEYCDLPTPCLFCSRIDVPFGKRKFESYNALICRSHREEISSLVSCRVHGNLTDVREMCEECFMPMHDKLKSMSGKNGSDIEQLRVQSLLLHKKTLLASSGPRICPCCHKSWLAKPYAQRFIKVNSVGFGASKANVKPPLPRVPGRSRFSRRNSFKKHRDRLSAPASPRPDGKSPSEAMCHVGNKELKYTSDSESEMPFSHGEKGVFAVRGRNYMDPEHDLHHVARTRFKSEMDDALLEKQSSHSSADITSFLDQHMHLETQKSLPTYGLEEINWEQLHPRPNSPVSPEFNLLDDVIKAPSNESGHGSLMVEPQPHMSSISMLSELIPLKNTPQGSDDKNEETLKSHDEDDMSLAQQPNNATEFSDGGVPNMSNDISPTSSSAMTDEGKEVSTTSVELSSDSGSAKFEDTKSFLQQSIPKHDDSLNAGASSPDASHMQNLATLEINESSLKFSERVSLSDAEGESSIDKLKSQIEFDNKCIYDLYKELEEERSAAGVAANQAMAMITRLQEEKAALHMEALQYLRMMDEQAEYDMEALQRANDLLAEKEKELQDLEYELELYRNNTNEGSLVVDPHKESIGTMGENTTEDSGGHHDGHSLSEPSFPVSREMSIADDISGNAKISMPNLDANLYLVEYLKQLETRIHKLSCIKPCTGLDNSQHLEINQNKIDYETNDQVDSEKEADGSHMQNGFNMVDGTSSKDSPTHQLEDRSACCEETNHNRSNLQNSSTSGRELNMESLENEIENFKEMLQAFEADREFIKHSLSALHNGNDGLKHIQKIIVRLQELWDREFIKRCLSIP